MKGGVFARCPWLAFLLPDCPAQPKPSHYCAASLTQLTLSPVLLVPQVRAIMAQYMELPQDDGGGANGSRLQQMGGGGGV